MTFLVFFPLRADPIDSCVTVRMWSPPADFGIFFIPWNVIPYTKPRCEVHAKYDDQLRTRTHNLLEIRVKSRTIGLYRWVSRSLLLLVIDSAKSWSRSIDFLTSLSVISMLSSRDFVSVDQALFMYFFNNLRSLRRYKNDCWAVPKRNVVDLQLLSDLKHSTNLQKT